MYRKRKMDATIRDWFAKDGERPLLVRGARRTGKTSTICHVGEELVGRGFVMLDFQAEPSVCEQVFSGDTREVDRIVRTIGDYAGTTLQKESSLIFLDEVQLNERALNALRFFSGSGWHVIASGSQLGVSAGRRCLPFPSGIKQATMVPFDFEEFLWALGEAPMANAIREHALSLEPYVLHDRAMQVYQRFLVYGGMPRCVELLCEGAAPERVGEALAEIDSTYTADMTNPENGISGVSALRIWNSLPAQLLRSSTKKFKYSEVVRGGRRQRLMEPLEWLAAAGVVVINDMTKDTEFPLVAFDAEEGSFFKVYMSDTGLMFRKFGINPRQFLSPEIPGFQLSSDFRGALAENSVMLALRANGLRTFYWTPPDSWKAKGEIDFLLQTDQAQVVPVEVKSGRNVRARTLVRFMQEGRSPYAVRLSGEQFGMSQMGEGGAWLRSLPLYAAFCLDEGFVRD